MITKTTKEVVRRGRDWVFARTVSKDASVEEMRTAIILYDVSCRLEELDALVDEAAEVVAVAPVSGPAGERWREDWLKRARATGVELMGGAS